MKKLLCALLTAAILLTLCTAFADTQIADGGMLTWEEISDWAAGMKARAMETKPLNDPTEPAAHSEDGYCLIYDFAYFYCDRPEMTADTAINDIVIYSCEEPGPRGSMVDMPASTLLSLYYNENSVLDGSPEIAVIYYSEMLPQEAGYGIVYRDGQRLQTIQYTVHDQFASGGDGYTNAGIVYTITEDEVSAIRLYGLSDRVDEAAVRADQAAAKSSIDLHGYTRVPTSTDGTKLSIFSQDDLAFDDFDFLTVTPAQAVAALGEPDAEDWIEQEDGTWLQSLSFEQCTLVFHCNKSKQEPAIRSLTIDDGMMEGPRGVRIGDSLSFVKNRFRDENTTWTDGAYVVLYGQKQQAPNGIAEYGDDASATLTYSLADDSGRTVKLTLHFELLILDRITLFVGE